MSHASGSVMQLSCPACGWHLLCGPGEMAARLRQTGMLKRATQPDLPLLLELFRTTATRLSCDQCRHGGLTVAPAPTDDWDDERLCEVCGRTIPRERRELLPASTLCVACQQRAESSPGGLDEYCPRCGAKMVVRQSSGRGLARYVTKCPECQR